VTTLMSDAEVVERIFKHIDNKSTDVGTDVWHEPVANYLSTERFNAEIELLRRLPVAFCPSAGLPESGSYIARRAAGVPLLVVRGDDGVVRAFRNACRHRGMPVAKSGQGCARSFICPYHSWVYDLDGALKRIADSQGFPGLDPSKHGLAPVHAVEERSGIVFVTQLEPVTDGALGAMPKLLDANQVMFNHTSFVDQANWKLIGETSMEGYHIASLHKETFAPYGFHNLNVVETFGTNSRIVFPFKRIKKLRDIPAAQHRLPGMVTDVYQLFPNTHVSVLSNHSHMIILEPVSPTETEWVIYQVSNGDADGKHKGGLADAKRDASFVQDTGLMEDRDAACGIQAGLASGANEHLTFGRYEKAAVHFHSTLAEHLNMLN
jgi:choline monooxygenase